MVMLLPMRGASVHINGVSAAVQQQQRQHLDAATASTHAAANSQQQQQQQQQPILLTHRSRVIFGRHHVLRFEGGGDAPLTGESHTQSATAAAAAVEVDWAFAQNELLRKNPELAPQVRGDHVFMLNCSLLC
jgi:hypothetical protein